MTNSTLNSPYLRQPASVQSVMLRVLAALLPGIAVYVWLFGAAILIQILLASVTALAAEAFMLQLRNKPLRPFLGDASALVTAWLLALCLPPLAPWWLVVVATLFAIIIVKQLYGGLGQNPFNPAMAAFCVMIVAFPQLMSQWPAPQSQVSIDLVTQLDFIFGARHPEQVDATTMATALDSLRTALHSRSAPALPEITASNPGFGHFAGQGWEWIALTYLIGGLWLLQQRIISWHIPLAFIFSLTFFSGLAQLLQPDQQAGPLFHLVGGGALLAAFFIITDPVSAATTPRGKLIYGSGIGFLTWVIRSYGAYPDGIAFATLLLNMCVPLIDTWTQPQVFGHKSPPRS